MKRCWETLEKNIARVQKMASARRMTVFDTLRFNCVNIDPFTETFNMGFYMQYLARWPQYCHTVVAPSGRIVGYIMGKSEGEGEDWHGHVTAITVAPEFRRLGTSTILMNQLEAISEREKGWFVDLFVRPVRFVFALSLSRN